MYQEGRFSQGGSDKEAFLEEVSCKCSRLHFPVPSLPASVQWELDASHHSGLSSLLLPTWNLGRPVTALTNGMMETELFLLPALNQALPPLLVVSVF